MMRLLFVFLAAAIPALGGGFQFPSAGSSQSPDGNWKLTCKSPGKRATDACHSLRLKKIHGKTFKLRRFDRGCDALWSPDSSWIALTDWLASDMSDVFIYSVANPGSGKSLGNLFTKGVIPDKERKGHCYFEATKWLDTHRLEIKVFGHTDESPVYGFEHHYIFDLTTGQLARRKKKPDQPATNEERALPNSCASVSELISPYA